MRANRMKKHTLIIFLFAIATAIVVLSICSRLKNNHITYVILNDSENQVKVELQVQNHKIVQTNLLSHAGIAVTERHYHEGGLDILLDGISYKSVDYICYGLNQKIIIVKNSNVRPISYNIYNLDESLHQQEVLSCE